MKRFKTNLPIIVSSLILIPSLIANLYFYQQAKDRQHLYTVKEVIDGDTLVLEDDIIVRLFRINAPELDSCGGPQAKDYLDKLVTNQQVSIQNQYRDQYGRLMALVFLKDKQLVNGLILKAGWARYDEVNFEYHQQLNDLQKQAEQNQIGIFSPLCKQFTNPNNPDCTIKGNVSKTDNKKTYHFPGCGRYQDIPIELDLGDQWFCTEQEAKKAGFTKSKNCFDKTY
ncbi:MAG: thermonuclease family protein [Patescibacteria group bacterium]